MGNTPANRLTSGGFGTSAIILGAAGGQETRTHNTDTDAVTRSLSVHQRNTTYSQLQQRWSRSNSIIYAPY